MVVNTFSNIHKNGTEHMQRFSKCKKSSSYQLLKHPHNENTQTQSHEYIQELQERPQHQHVQQFYTDWAVSEALSWAVKRRLQLCGTVASSWRGVRSFRSKGYYVVMDVFPPAGSHYNFEFSIPS